MPGEASAGTCLSSTFPDLMICRGCEEVGDAKEAACGRIGGDPKTTFT